METCHIVRKFVWPTMFLAITINLASMLTFGAGKLWLLIAVVYPTIIGQLASIYLKGKRT